jgi:hypothetical protein
MAGTGLSSAQRSHSPEHRIRLNGPAPPRRPPRRAQRGLTLRATSVDVAARLTPLDPWGKPAAPPNPVPPRCGRCRAAARSRSVRAIAAPTPHRTRATATEECCAGMDVDECVCHECVCEPRDLNGDQSASVRVGGRTTAEPRGIPRAAGVTAALALVADGWSLRGRDWF